MRRGVVLSVVVVAILAGVMARSQSVEDAEERTIGGLAFVDEVQVTVVNVDVFVRDAKGRPVSGLTKDDFRLLQDGSEVTITNFAELDRNVIQHVFATGEQSPPTVIEEVPEELPEIRPVYVVFYVDHENIRPLDRNRVLRRVRSFVTENLKPPVRMMVIGYQRSLDVVQPFTEDSRAIKDALQSMATVTGGRIERDRARDEIYEDLQEAKEQGLTNTNAGTGRGPSTIRQDIIAFASEEANSLTFSLAAMRETLAMLSGVEGRKSIIYISSGLPMTPGLDLMREYAAVFRDNSIMARRSSLDKTRVYHELAAAANAQDVSFYTLDAEGLTTLDGFDVKSQFGRDVSMASIGTKNYKDSLDYLADTTGGIAIINTNDVSGGLEKISEDLYNYYSLGYSLPTAGGDRVHRLEVELPGHRDYDLRYRRRFVEKSLATQVQDRVFSSLMVDIDDNPMSIELTTGRPVPASGETWSVPVHLSFPLDRVALLQMGTDYVGQVTLYIGARDMRGRNTEIRQQEHEIRIPVSDYERALEQDFGIDFSLLLLEDRHRIAVGLYDQITRNASYERIVVTVP